MPLKQDTGNRHNIQPALLKSLDDHASGLRLISTIDLLLCQKTGTGNGAIESVSMSRSHYRNI
ncbi:hypothetical protein D3C72_2295380 [compost metagenome]